MTSFHDTAGRARRHVFASALIAALLLAACGGSSSSTDKAHTHGPGESHATAPTKGPHGGRLLTRDGFALEVQIFEDGVPPEFRLYPTLDGKPLPLAEVQARIELARLNGLPGGRKDLHVFTPKGDHLASGQTVYEPHSYAVQVRVTHGAKSYTWNYDSPEGRVQIAADMAAANGLATAPAGAGSLHETLALYGQIRPDAERQRAVTARFPGLVRSVAVQVGDTVRAGQTLATVESNESLQVYAVTAPLAGTVTRRATNPGEAAGSEPLFEIADFSRVWAELSVFPRDRARLKLGQAVTVKASDGATQAAGEIAHVAPVGTAGQALTARVLLDNRENQWTPGQFVDGRVTVGQSAAPLVVPLAALQTFRDWDVVFAADGDTYQALPVQLGRRDAERVEVLSGLEAGARIVTANSYLVKADIEKSGASHDH